MSEKVRGKWDSVIWPMLFATVLVSAAALSAHATSLPCQPSANCAEDQSVKVLSSKSHGFALTSEADHTPIALATSSHGTSNLRNAALFPATRNFSVTGTMTPRGEDPVIVTPEPSTLGLVGTGLLGMAMIMRRRFQGRDRHP